MTQVEKSKEDLWSDIQQLCDAPLNLARAAKLVEYMAVYDALCRASQKGGRAISKERGPSHFTREMAEDWTANMENEDGTQGPHWPLERIQKEMEQHGVKCDPVKFWAVINAIYSDDVAVAKKHGVNTMEYYIDRTKAWLEDKDAVPDKAGAYYMYVVEHR